METKLLAIIGATLVPLALGFIWYHPKVFGNAWMKAAGISPDSAKGANMKVVFGVTLVFAFFLAVIMQALVVHQGHFTSILTFQPDSADPNSESSLLLKKLMSLYGNSHRSFSHGAFHGTLAGMMIALPIMGINALFERKGFRYIAVNSGYWIVCFALMGGIICAFA